MNHQTDVCVVIPTFNKSDRWPKLAHSLEAQTLDPDRFEVIVVDDCSTDSTYDVLLAVAGSSRLHYTVLRTPANSGGPSQPRNLGWRTTAAPVIAFLDDDCTPEPDWLHNGLKAMETEPLAGVIQGRTVAPPDSEIEEEVGRWHVGRSVIGETVWFECANIFYRRDALAEVGGFDESIPTWGEDTDLGWRVVEAGWGRSFADNAVVVHDVEDRGWRYAARFAWLDRKVIMMMARRHPQVRAGFWRPWAKDRPSAEFAGAVAGGLLALKWKPAALLALPYLWLRRPSIRRKDFIPQCAQIFVVDSVRFVSHLIGSVSARVFVL